MQMKARSLFLLTAAFAVLLAASGCGPESGPENGAAPSGAVSSAPGADVGQGKGPVAVRIAAWNMKWFPSGHPVLEDKDRDFKHEWKRIDSAARFIAWQKADIVMLEEVRDREVCSMLCTNEALAGWSVDAVTAFERAPDATIPPHQNAIVSRFAAIDSGWRRWKGRDGIVPPRGFVYAVYDLGGTLCAVAGVHLKSNFIPQDAENPDELPAQNRRMREVSAQELVAFARELMAKDYGGRKVSAVIVGGDFNTSIFDPKYDGEKTVPAMLEAGFRDCFDGVAERDTMPESKWYPATCFDYLFVLGGADFSAPVVAPKSWTSDHQMISAIFGFGK